MSTWLGLVALVAAGLAWLEYRRPNRSNLVSRVSAVLVAVAAIIVLLLTRGGSGRVTLLTPGAPLTSHNREAIALDQAQSLASLASRQTTIRLAGWGLLPHEWPDEAVEIAGFEPSELPVGITQLDAPTEAGVGERMSVRGMVNLPPSATGWIILEDPAAPRDSAPVSGARAQFALSDRPRAEGPVAYRIRLRTNAGPEIAETIGVAVRKLTLPTVLILDASPSFETGYLKRWLSERGAEVTIRTAISREKYRTERLNGAGGDVGRLTAGLLARYQAVLVDGGSLAALSPPERSALEQAVRERGVGLLVTADAPWILARGNCGLLNGFAVDPITTSLAAVSGDKGDRRVARPVIKDGPKPSRTGIDVEAASIRSAGIDPIVHDETGRMIAGWRKAGAGRVGMTLLRAPSRWLLEGENDLFAGYWDAMLRAVAHDTISRAYIGAEGPLRADHPVFVTIESSGVPRTVILSPAGETDTIPLAQDPFDPAKWTGRYWPREAGWHRLQLVGGRTVPFRVTPSTEWIGVEASARLAATAPRVGRSNERLSRELARTWLSPLAFGLLLLSLSWLWIESRLSGRP